VTKETPTKKEVLVDVQKTPVPLPYWPAELERQFQRWMGREPWWSQYEELRYVRRAAWGDEPRPSLPVGSWGRFFIWRWQMGYGTKDFAWTAMQGAVAAELRLGQVQHSFRQGTVGAADIERLALWAITPLYAAVQASAWGPRELFHRNTARKLERLRLLPDVSASIYDL
jgi:hypothetical protein